MNNETAQADYPLDCFTIVNLIDGHTKYIQEFFVLEDIKDKEELDITLVYLVLDNRNSVQLAYPDEKSKIKVAEIKGMRKICLK